MHYMNRVNFIETLGGQLEKHLVVKRLFVKQRFMNLFNL